MQVKCESTKDFLCCLNSLLPGEDVFEQTVRYSVSSREKNSLANYVVITLSAVVSMAGGGEYLLEGAEDCGLDFKDSGGAYKGTAKADEILNELRKICTEKNWRLLPGIIGV